MGVTFPEPDDSNEFISWMRKAWEDRTGTFDEHEFWAFVKATTDLATNWQHLDDEDTIL